MNQFIDDVLSGRVVLPMVPHIVLQLLAELRCETAQLGTVAELIERDPVLGSRILRLANSSYFGGRRTVDSLSSAVWLIGTRPLTTLVVASGAQSALADVPSVNLRAFWETAQATASAARSVASRLSLDGDAAYSAGLLCGVGHLILCRCQPEVAGRAFGQMHMRWGAELARAEEQAFGVAHPAVGAIWVDRLGLPERVVQAIALCQSDPSVQAPPLARALQIGCVLAAAWAAGVHPAADLSPDLLVAAGLPDYVASGEVDQDLAALSPAPAALTS